MQRSLVLSTNAFRPLIEVARQAEAAGFHRLWTTESTPRDALVRAVTLGLHTERIKVATGISYAFTRAPLAMAAAAADAHIATGGRFSLGLGAGTKGMRTRRYGIHDFDHPGPRLADYVRLLRAAWSAESGLSYNGPFYQASVPTPLVSGELQELPPLEVFGSGVNRRMLQDSAASCDGVALHPLVSYLPYLDRVARPALGEKTQIAAWRVTSVHEDAGEARELARRNLAFYFTTPSYAPVVEGGRWAKTVTTIRDTFRAEPTLSWQELAAHVPDEMVEDFCLTGTPADIDQRARELENDLAERGVHELVFQIAGIGLAADEFVDACRRLLDALAPGGARA
ncbi:alkanesulfonate monooxygenase SsuD/methylene tetrahydromethanopterin reductase-like flavin-dependent oxidoreductase (luciferase family) [Amycolatopsis bartoniae]|uniref:LLM class F420-dependent oxidoreductase n=1 Tax=Amycolatopsis bartoniae TaxID=941986 RepID=A0A8H9MBE6_9PSEU|nr:LLM class flavin-dependent oxidoreductase [Amycolatopsis bartoniae]MBB2940239.1 alkanesulfonate monooxygenase SsuD/methylene tetrahydromethanopterin reductase-like flavin-dependent oxidoreductase (luciferase family) [Amycolatopsis bartoniae]GHF34952.1 LLM class F420-dependent oxidoreductase [Amycolatopsis bartoniae]